MCNTTEQYVELEFGPHGEHLVLFLNGVRNDIMKMLPLNYNASIGKYCNSIAAPVFEHFPARFLLFIQMIYCTDENKKRWSGVAHVPADYFPPNVTHFNAYAIHNQQINGSEPIYKALYPSSGSAPDFHDLESFEEFSELPLLQTITDYSDIWKDALEDNGSSCIKMFNAFFYFLLMSSIIVMQ